MNRALPGPNTARVAITILIRAKRPSLIVLCAYQANTALVRNLSHLLVTVLMDITVLLVHQSLTSGLPSLAASQTLILNGKLRQNAIRKPTTTCGMRQFARIAQLASFAENRESLTLFPTAKPVTFAKLAKKIQRCVNKEHTTQLLTLCK